jgi:spore maturation protein CgeB
MRIVIFCHSLISDWNHGNAHFLRGIAGELLARGHEVVAYEPADGWSLTHLIAEAGADAVDRFHRAFPALQSRAVDLQHLSLDEALDGADLVLVHEWNPPSLVERIGRHKVRGAGRYALLFHDTHHRSVSDVEAMERYRLEHYDGVLAFGEVIRERYVERGWSRRVWTWHEAADVRTFRPIEGEPAWADLVWIGNWGDDERSAELRSYLIAPVRETGLTATVHGVRYPAEALRELETAGIAYGGWLPNYEAPCVYARHRMTVHVPRRPYMEALPGIPTIRVFEALACGLPLISLDWRDVEGLFTPGLDYLIAKTPAGMKAHMRTVKQDQELRRSLAAHGLQTVLSRHTCGHRVDELMAIVDEIRQPARDVPVAAESVAAGAVR